MTTKAQHATQPPLGGTTGEAPPGPDPSTTGAPGSGILTTEDGARGLVAPGRPFPVQFPDPPPRTEFPVSASLKAYLPPYKEATDDPRLFDIFITMRGESGKDVMERLASAIEWVCKHGGTGTIWPAGTQVHQPAPSPIPAEVAMAGPHAASGKIVGYTDALRIAMSVDGKNGKPILEFWGLPERPDLERQYAEERVSGWGLEAVNRLLEPLGLEFKAGTVEAKPVRIHWEQGKEKVREETLPDGTVVKRPTGHYYHNITRLEWLP